MKAMKAVLCDRKRAQRGGVLSGVLIMVAFLAILSGAVMTELSTHFLISRALVNRVAVEATVNSAMELALDQLQHSALMSGCPGVPPNAQGPPTATVNGRTAAVSYVSCWPTVDVGSRTFPPIASSSPFSIDATHSTIPAMGRDLYLAGASGGWIYQYMWGGSLNWSLNLNSTITGPPLAMQDAAANPPDTGTPSGSGNNADIANLVPIVGGGSSGCSAAFCVELLGEDTGPAPDVFCFMATNDRLTCIEFLLKTRGEIEGDPELIFGNGHSRV